MTFKPELLRFQFRNFPKQPTNTPDGVTSKIITDCNGIDWFLKLYPDGEVDTEEGYASLYLMSSGMDHCIDTIKVKYQFILRDATGNNIKWESRMLYHEMEAHTEYGRGHFLRRDELLDKKNRYLKKDGSLHIYVSIQVKTPQHEFYQPPNNVCQNMLALLRSGEDSDISFKLDGTVINAHSQILCANAPFLLNFIKRKNKTLKKGTPIVINQTTPEVFNYMLQYIYAREIPDIATMVKHGKDIIQAANKFELVGLKMAIENALVQNCVVDRTNVSDYILFADAMMCPLLKEYAFALFIKNVKDILNSPESEQLKASPQLLQELLIASNHQYESQISAKSVSELRKLLAKKKLDVDGSKEVLVERLEKATNDDSMDEDSSDENDDEENDFDSNDMDDEDMDDEDSYM